MKSKIVVFIGVCVLSASAMAQDAPTLAKSKNCMSCHAAEKKLVGPSYKDVATKYKDDKNAVASLSKKIIEGGKGVWGQLPMPPNKGVSEAEAKILAEWVMQTK